MPRGRPRPRQSRVRALHRGQGPTRATSVVRPPRAAPRPLHSVRRHSMRRVGERHGVPREESFFERGHHAGAVRLEYSHQGTQQLDVRLDSGHERVAVERHRCLGYRGRSGGGGRRGCGGGPPLPAASSGQHVRIGQGDRRHHRSPKAPKRFYETTYGGVSSWHRDCVYRDGEKETTSLGRGVFLQQDTELNPPRAGPVARAHNMRVPPPPHDVGGPIEALRLTPQGLFAFAILAVGRRLG